MTKNNDQSQLQNILEQFDGKTISEVVAQITEGAYCQKKVSDFDDPGKEVEVGSENRVALEDLSAQERIVAESNFLPSSFLQEGAISQGAVARVTLKESHRGLPAGSGWGTGFLISNSLLMTNNHVIPSREFAKKVSAQFNYQTDVNGNALPVDEFRLDPDSVFYTNSALDFTIVRLSKKSRFMLRPTIGASSEFAEAQSVMQQEAILGAEERIIGDLSTRPLRPLRPDWTKFVKIFRVAGERWGHISLKSSLNYSDGQNVNVIQHPRGRRKEVALQSNLLSNVYSNHIRYTTDTEPGSSGSPVFNNSWDLIAIHHAGGEFRDGAWRSNQGVRMDRIIANIRSHYSGSATGNTILNEIGI